MERKYKITISEPCQEDWTKMTPNDQGRFCMSCAKTVVDFTAMLPEEIQHFFIQNQSQNICGRMRKSQLDSITIQIPSRVLYKQTQYHKMFLLALFITMGTTLFSCADKNGNKQKIDAVEVVKDTTKASHITVGMMLPEKNNTQNHVQPPAPATKANNVKFINLQTIACEETQKNETVAEDVIYNGGIGFEFPAEYPGGIEKFYTFFKKEFNQPQNINNKIIEISISFVVDKDGSITYVKPKSEIEVALENEIVRVLKLCPRWKPGEQNGKKTRTLYTETISLI